MPPRNPLPTFYYRFFGLFEPTLTLIGAYLAVFTPGRYAADLLPEGVERVTGVLGDTVRGGMIIGGLGSCFFLLAMINLSIFHVARHHLQAYPIVQAKVVKALLIPLAIADLSHIAVTLLPLPLSQITSPSKWTTTLHGNISITLFLFLVRSAYFMGIGRSRSSRSTPSAGAGGGAAPGARRKSHGQAEVPLPPARKVRAGEETVKAVERVEVAGGSPDVRRRGKQA